MKYEQKTNTGSLFKNQKKETEKHPDYTGSLKLEDGDYMISAWIKEGKSGNFLSLSIRKKEDLNLNKKIEELAKSIRKETKEDLPF